MTSESFSVRWKKSLNVYLENGEVIRAEFSEVPCMERIETSKSLNLKKDLKRYFKGDKVDFLGYSVKLESKFVLSVLEKVRRIPYGKTSTYGEIAGVLKTAPRAVGQALKRNPAPVIIPCHRVVGVKGAGGYSQGLNIKKMLLELEGIKL